jgi:predicted DNA-binding transcriptional regulator YafY
MERMRCSRPTVFRLLKTLEEQLGAPIIRDKERGYRYDTTNGHYELPGLWFTGNELQALVVIERFLDELGEVLLEEHFALLRKRLEELTSKNHLNLSEVVKPPTVGAGCLNWARPDLRGGHPERDVPTAIVEYTAAYRMDLRA